jgi:hypothetical protein
MVQQAWDVGLNCTNLPLIDVAAEVGFASQNHRYPTFIRFIG